MLSSQFSFLCQPVMEQSLTRNDHFQWLQSNIFPSFGFIVRVNLFQCSVKYRGELFYGIRHFGKFYQPLVPAFCVLIHKHRRRRVFANLCSGFGASLCQSFFSIIDNQLFTKCIDEMLRSSRDDKLIGILAGKLHSITNHVSPQTTGSRNNHCIVLVELDFFKTISPWIFFSHFLQRNKFVENSIVDH